MVGCRRRPQWLSLLLASATVVAAEPPPPAATSKKPVEVPAARAPTPQEMRELLLYVAEFEETDAEWIDPTELPPVAEPGGDADDLP